LSKGGRWHGHTGADFIGSSKQRDDAPIIPIEGD